MIKYYSRFLFITVLYLCAVIVLPQEISHLGVNDGLSGRQTFNIVQDKKNFLWISTRLGVDRYDGVNIKNYPMDILQNGSIPTRSIKVLLGKDNTIWAYTDRGTIYKYDELSDKFIRYIDLKRYIKWLHIDTDNRIWIMDHTDIGILKEDSVIFLRKQKLKNDLYKSITNFDDDNLLIQTHKNVYKYDIKNDIKYPILDASIFLKEDIQIETCLYDNRSDRLWIGSVNNGLYLYLLKEKKLITINEPSLWHHPILSLNTFGESRLIIGTDGFGVCLLNTETLRLEQAYNQHSKNEYYIRGDAIYSIFKDIENRIWLSTYSDGVYIFDYSQHGFKTIKYEKGNEKHLSRNVICDILEDSSGNLWFATNNDLCLWNKKQNKWTRLLESKNILTLYEDSEQNIWVGTYSSGVFKLKKDGSIISNYIKTSNNSIGTDFVYTIYEDIQGNVWFGGRRGDMTKFDKRQNRFIQIPIGQVNHIIQKDKSTILISSELGVFQANINSLKYTGASFNKNLKSKYISDMYLESDSILWLGTYGNGLNRCNIISGTIQSFSQKEGLPSDIIYAMEVDNKKNLWFSSENGIGCFNLETHTITNFSITDGLSGNQFRQLSKAKTQNGDIYFGSYEGVTYFNPDNIKKRQGKAHLFLESFSLFNKVVLPNDNNSPLKRSLDETKTIKLNYKQHSFSVNFVAIDYSKSKTRRYMWMLENMDQDWISPTNEHIANYTNIAAGNYTFKVRYLDDNNNILDERSLSIKVSPPFWDTVWARMIFLLFILTVTYFIYKYAEQQLKKKQSQEKIKFFINTAHDIRTPLTLISGPIYELKEQLPSSPNTDYLLNLVTNNLSKLNNMFSQLLDFQKAYESQNRLVIKKRNVKEYLNEKLIYWKSSAQKKNILIDLLLPDETVEEWFDIEKIDKILDNLVSNAIKYTQDGGNIKIRLSIDNSLWKITVTDNGIGISKQDQKNLFKRFYRAGNAINSQVSGSGLGLLLVQKYVTEHKGDIGVNSMENKGSEFYVQFKRGNKIYQNNILLDDQNIPIFDESEVSDNSYDTENLRLKILIVEDNNDLRSYIKLSLSSYYSVYTAENGAVAWNNILKINPDIVISDLQMPEMDGFELCKKIKTTFETSHIPVILLTVVNDKINVTEGFNLAVDDYIEKPFDIKYLRLKINNIIQNRKILRQKFLGIDREKIQISDQISENEHNRHFIEKATSIVKANISNTDFSITIFSKEMGLSRTLLYTKFYSITGYTPNDFIKIVRMNEAISYFKEKKYTINEVALMVGFEEPAYFSTSFKKIYGKSPKQFIEENIL